ncbi:uncharacterized protein [Montipora foliosa]|uniref:uncharacterized protein n=1 Tax=Montipora foliosa TaxID=591990 RepID=UPI0035F1AA73
MNRKPNFSAQENVTDRVVTVLDSFFWASLQSSLNIGLNLSALRKSKVVFITPPRKQGSVRPQHLAGRKHRLRRTKRRPKLRGVMRKMAECLANDVQPLFSQGDSDELRLYIAHAILHTEECVRMRTRICTDETQATSEVDEKQQTGNTETKENICTPYKKKLRRKSKIKKVQVVRVAP